MQNQLLQRLVTAANIGDFPAAMAAITSGAPVDRPSSDEYTTPPLRAAATSGHQALFVHLLARGADMNDDVLPYVVASGTPEMTQTIIDAGVNINSAYNSQASIFDAIMNHRDTVSVLLADPRLRLNVKSFYGDSPVEFAEGEWRRTTVARIEMEVCMTVYLCEWMNEEHWSSAAV